MPNPKKRKKILIIATIAMVLVLLTLVAVFKKRTPAITVQTDKVARHDITEKVVANGKIYPVMQVHISPEVSGEIIVLAVKEGQYVHKGDLLLKILPDVYLAAVNQAKANYESSLAGKTQAVANLGKGRGRFHPQQGTVRTQTAFGIGLHWLQSGARCGRGATGKRQ